MANRKTLRDVLVGVVVTVIGGLLVVVLTSVFRIGASSEAGPAPSAPAPLPQTLTPSAEARPSTGASPDPPPAGADRGTTTPSMAGWLADMKPTTDVGLWNGGTGDIRSKTYVHSLNVPTEWGDGQTSWARWALDGQETRLTGLVGIEDGGNASEKAIFEIVVDGSTAAQYEVAIGGTPPSIDLSLKGVHDLTLRVTNVSPGLYAAQAVFADFRVE